VREGSGHFAHREKWPPRKHGAASAFCSAIYLLELKSARDGISLIPNTRNTVAQPGEVKHVSGPIISLQKLEATHHRFACLSELIRNRNAVESAIELFFLALDETGHISQLLIEVPARQIGHRNVRVDDFLAHPQVPIQTVTIQEFRMVMNSIAT